MREARDIILQVLRTEKGARLGDGTHVFSVAAGSNKIEIRQAVERLFKVKVARVRTMHVPGKPKRIRYHLGRTPAWRKAIVTLAAGQKLDLPGG